MMNKFFIFRINCFILIQKCW